MGSNLFLGIAYYTHTTHAYALVKRLNGSGADEIGIWQGEPSEANVSEKRGSFRVLWGCHRRAFSDSTSFLNQYCHIRLINVSRINMAHYHFIFLEHLQWSAIRSRSISVAVLSLRRPRSFPNTSCPSANLCHFINWWVILTCRVLCSDHNTNGAE